jgi:hypothetical protein
MHTDQKDSARRRASLMTDITGAFSRAAEAANARKHGAAQGRPMRRGVGETTDAGL